MSDRPAQEAAMQPAEYHQATDRALERLCGIGYGQLVAMAPALDRSADLARAAKGNIPPDAFAEAFRRTFGLSTVQERGDDAPEINRYRAALVEFTAGSRWSLSPGAGPATLRVGNDKLTMDVVQRDGKFAFGVSCGDELPCVRLDIGDAVMGAMLDLRQRREARAAEKFGTIAPDAEPQPSTPGMGGRH